MVRQEIEGSKKFGKFSEYSYLISKIPSQLYKLYLLSIDLDTDFFLKRHQLKLIIIFKNLQ